MSRYFGKSDRRLALAREWAREGFNAGGPGIGVVVVWPHHVGVITGQAPDGEWIVHSGNDGGAVRTRARSIARHRLQARLTRTSAASHLKQIAPIRTGKLAKISECAARCAAMAALNLRRGGGAFRAIEHDAERVAIDADDPEIRTRVWRGRNARGL